MASWGEAMGEAREHSDAWWLVAFPGVALLAALVALNLVGDAARDAVDPRLRGALGDASVRE
jgi:ABC-type dipeptide/oligopeptide/nickel transport system permease subunit